MRHAAHQKRPITRYPGEYAGITVAVGLNAGSRDLRPVFEIAKRLAVGCIERIQHVFKFGVRIAEHHESGAFNHAGEALCKCSRKRVEVQKCGSRIYVSFVHMDRRVICAYKSLIAEGAGFLASETNHLLRQKPE